MSSPNYPSPYEAAQLYLTSQNQGEQRTTAYFSDALQTIEQSNRAFRAGEYAATIFVPALITEEDGLGHTLDLIRDQKADTAVVISANLALGGTLENTAIRNVKEIQERVHSFPDFPMAFYLAGYDAGATIGRIARDGYAVIMDALVRLKGRNLQNMPMIRWDADTRYANQDYLNLLTQTATELDQPNYHIHPIVQHDRLNPDVYPNINRSLDWYDLNMRVSQIAVSAHFAVDLLGYASVDGTPPTSNVSENLAVLDRMKANPDLPKLQDRVLFDTYATVSCRRLAKRSATEGVLEYDALYMPSGDRPTHRNEPAANDISEDDYRKQVGFIAVRTIQRVGDIVYKELLEAGESQAAATEETYRAMEDFGATALQKHQDPPSMNRVLEAAIKTWGNSGPLPGTPRRHPMPKIRRQNLFFRPEAGGEGVLFQ
jgi:hypothetical protein